MAGERKVVIIAGAGATRSDAVNMRVPDDKSPPLDKGFFASVGRGGYDEFRPARAYMMENYGIDPAEELHDSLEKVMGAIYSDAVSPTRGVSETKAEYAMQSLLLAVPRSIADTTNDLLATFADSDMHRIVSDFLRSKISPDNLTVITFNYDLQTEKALHAIQVKQDGVFHFPHCYQLPRWRIATPRNKNTSIFRRSTIRGGIRVLKLHGSLNWLGMHKRPPSAKEMPAPKKENMCITRRMRIDSEMKVRENARSESAIMHTYPLIIPPVAHKAGLFPDFLADIWRKARAALEEATEVVIFGYSCPQQDAESANLIGGSFRKNSSVKISVIDTSSATFRRYIDLTGLSRLCFYRTAEAFIRGGVHQR